MNQTRDRISGLEVKIEELDKIAMEYVILFKHRKGKYRKCGTV